MGLERLVSILQDKDSNYDTDIFTPIFAVIKDICKCDDYGGLVGEADAKNGMFVHVCSCLFMFVLT